MKKVLSVLVTAVMMFSLVGCGDKKFADMKFNDGEYVGIYVDEEGMKSKSEVTITIKDGKIVAAALKEMDAKGKVKGEDYGKEAGEANYAIAQKSVKGAATYAPKLVEVQDPELVDAASGATASHKAFKAAVWQALDKAEK